MHHCTACSCSHVVAHDQLMRLPGMHAVHGRVSLGFEGTPFAAFQNSSTGACRPAQTALTRHQRSMLHIISCTWPWPLQQTACKPPHGLAPARVQCYCYSFTHARCVLRIARENSNVMNVNDPLQCAFALYAHGMPTCAEHAACAMPYKAKAKTAVGACRKGPSYHLTAATHAKRKRQGGPNH